LSTGLQKLNLLIILLLLGFLPGCLPFFYRPDYSSSIVQYKSVLDLFSQNREELNIGVRYPKIIHGSLNRRAVAITFDRGPHQFYTPKILQILKQYRAKATFFVTGDEADKNSLIVRTAVMDGHEIAISSYHFVNLTKIPENEVDIEIEAAGQEVKFLTGTHPRFFRPPGGLYNYAVANQAQALGYVMVLWTNNFEIYLEAGQKDLSLGQLNEIKNGAILLFWDSHPMTVKILPKVLDYLEDQGFEIIPLEQMSSDLQEEN